MQHKEYGNHIQVASDVEVSPHMQKLEEFARKFANEMQTAYLEGTILGPWGRWRFQIRNLKIPGDPLSLQWGWFIGWRRERSFKPENFERRGLRIAKLYGVKKIFISFTKNA